MISERNDFDSEGTIFKSFFFCHEPTEGLSQIAIYLKWFDNKYLYFPDSNAKKMFVQIIIENNKLKSMLPSTTPTISVPLSAHVRGWKT